MNLPKQHLRATDLLGLSRLAIDATTGVTDIVEAMHHQIVRLPGTAHDGATGRTSGITGMVYRSVRGVTRLVGSGLDSVLGALAPAFKDQGSSNTRESVLAALNGVCGDYLAASGNSLAIPMQFRQHGVPLKPNRADLQHALPQAGGKILLLAHGLCMNDLQWQSGATDFGTALAQAFGYTPVYLHYNTGLHISSNGRALSLGLDRLIENWPVPVESLTILAHSMGGLVARSACHYGAASRWRGLLRDLVFLGAPHLGAPLERAGNGINMFLARAPYAAPLARLGNIRSAGITDLRHGYVLDEQWLGSDRFASAHVPEDGLALPDGVRCYAIAASKSAKSSSGRKPTSDGLVGTNSALGRHASPLRSLKFPTNRQWLAYGTNHFELITKAEIHQRVKDWLTPVHL